MSENKEPVMQDRCIYCKMEQYIPAVYSISHGESCCVWCGKVPPVFTDEKEYREELRKPIKEE